jgi:hypothetical protein
VLGIPASAIYWWIHSLVPGVWYPGYWGQWTHWIIIASAILAALWILRLIMWIIAKKRESRFYQEVGRAMNVPHIGQSYYFGPDGSGATYSQEVESDADWVAPEHGPATRPKRPKVSEPIVSEPISYVAPEPLGSQSIFQQGQEFLRTKAETELINEETELVKELKEEIRDKRQRERQEHDISLDSLSKKYGIDPKRFKL